MYLLAYSPPFFLYLHSPLRNEQLHGPVKRMVPWDSKSVRLYRYGAWR